jgi:hypothetical protein
MSYLLSDKRMSDRERVCAAKWLDAAIDREDAALAEYWRDEGLAAREARLNGHPEPRRRTSAPTCPGCGTVSCTGTCLL